MLCGILYSYTAYAISALYYKVLQNMTKTVQLNAVKYYRVLWHQTYTISQVELTIRRASIDFYFVCGKLNS